MKDSTSFPLGPALGLLSIRIWLGVRSIVSGIEKFAGRATSAQPVNIDGAPNEYGLTETVTDKAYALANYQGIPESMLERFENEPLLPGFALTAFDWVLGPALLLFGLTVLLGIAPRISLFAMGLVYISLTVGLVLIGQDSGVAWMAAHMILIGFALYHADNDRLALLARKW